VGIRAYYYRRGTDGREGDRREKNGRTGKWKGFAGPM